MHELAARAGLPAENLLRGLPVPRDRLLDVRHRIDWDVFADFVDHWVGACGSDDAVLRISRDFPQAGSLGYVRRLAPFAASPAALQRFFDRWVGPANVSNMVVRPESLPDGNYRVTLTMPEPFKPSRGFLLGTVAVYESLPTLLGLAPARVEATVGERSATYCVQFPPSGTLWARLRRRIGAVRGLGTVAEMLRRQHDEVVSGHARAERQRRDFTHLLGSISDGVVLLDADRVVYANASLLALLRITEPAGLLCRPLAGRLSAADRGIFDRLAPGAACDLHFAPDSGPAVRCEVWDRGTVLFDDTEVRLVVLREVAERRGLAHEIARAVRHEREQIAHDLHDDAGQLLAGAALKAGLHADELARAGSPQAAKAAELAGLVERCGHRVRHLAHTLSPVALAQQGLGPALRQLAADSATLFEIECRCAPAVPADLSLPAETTAELHRIAQESINNAVRHGRARRIVLALEAAAGGIRLRIEDDGCGFPAQPVPSTGIGLNLMHHRAASVGGRIEFGRAALGGAQVVCHVPGATFAPAEAKPAPAA